MSFYVKISVKIVLDSVIILGGATMIWLYFLIPVVVIGGIAIYFEKKSGMTPPEESKQRDKLAEVKKQNSINYSSGGTE